MLESLSSSAKAASVTFQQSKDAELKGLTQVISHSSENDENSDPQNQSAADSQPVALKSFGIRKAELEIAQITSSWHKLFYFFTLFLGMFILMADYLSSTVFVGYATNSYKQHSLMSQSPLLVKWPWVLQRPFLQELLTYLVDLRFL